MCLHGVIPVETEHYNWCVILNIAAEFDRLDDKQKVADGMQRLDTLLSKVDDESK